MCRTFVSTLRGMMKNKTRCSHVVLVAALLFAAGCRDSATDATNQLVPPVQDDVVIHAVEDFGAKPDGISDNEPALQRALDHASSLGGGTVLLAAGVYGISLPLIVDSRVRLVGEGQGKTILRSLVSDWGKIVKGAGVWAAVAMVAADDASVSELTVDLSVAQTHSNGISILPAGAAFEGQVSTNCEISGVEVIGGGNHHAYMIWNLRGRGVRIVNNVVDGGITASVASSNQEGIESYGGQDVLVGWNLVRNIGNTALNFGSAGLPDTGIDHLEVVGNVVRNSGRGLNIGPWMGPAGPENVSNVLIEGNDFSDLWQTGIYVQAQPGTDISGLQIVDNTIQSVGSADSIGATTGIHFQGTPSSADLPASTSSGNIVRGNRIHTVAGTNALGVLVNYHPNVSLIGNSINRVGYAIQAFGSSNLLVQENGITDIDYVAVGSYGPFSSVYVRNNIIEKWGQANSNVTAVVVDDAQEGDVRGNTFRSQVIVGSAVRVGAGAANVVVFGNELFSPPGSTADPFLNLGANSNLGAFVAEADITTVSIPNSLVVPTSIVVGTQTRGAPLPFSIVAEAGRIQVTFSKPPLGGEAFRYEIDP